MSMTNEQLALEIQKGNNELMGQLWEQVKNYIYWLAQRLYSRFINHCASSGITIDDIKQCGFLALHKAVIRYDILKDCKFETLVQSVFKYDFYSLINMYSKNKKKIPLNICMSIDKPVTDEENTTFADTITDQTALYEFDNVIDSLHNEQLKQCLDECMATLPDEQVEVLTERYYNNKSIVQIAKESNKSDGTIYKTEKKALQGMRQGDNLSRLQAYREHIMSRQLRYTGYRCFRQTGLTAVEWAVLKLAEIGVQV